MTVGNKARVFLIAWMCATAGAGTPPAVSPATDLSTSIEIDQVQVTGRIDGRQLNVTVEFEAKTKKAMRRMVLIQGNAVLGGDAKSCVSTVPADARLDYDPNSKTYYVTWPKSGNHRLSATFMAQSLTEPDNLWRQASLQVPAGRVRQVRIVSSQPDLEVQLPGALRVQRRIEQGSESSAKPQLVVEALLGPREPLEIRWKPQVQLADAKLVLSGQANTIVDVRAGLLQVDALFDFQVAQGKLETLTFHVPAGLSITAVHGLFVRTWTLGDATQDGVRPLRVELSRAQDKDYRLHVRAEATIDSLPSTVAIPAIEPVGDIRVGGHLAVGTNSALQLVVQESSGLTQIDGAAFPRVEGILPSNRGQEARDTVATSPRVEGVPPSDRGPEAHATQARPMPQGKAFFYTYAGSRYHLRLTVDDITPTYEVAERLVAKVKEDDLVVDVDLELDIRDAPLRQLEIAAPAALVVATVDGNQVEDYHLPETAVAGRPTPVRVVFKQPVIGRTLLHLRLELGRGPLGEQQSLPALQVVGAKTQRGYVIVATEAGIEIDPPQAQNLREVHTASVPLRVAEAQYAYRFREADWALSLMARRRPAEARAEVFQLQSIGETLAYGSAAINYLITGSPVDELKFDLPESFENVEFVGRDVRRWIRQDGVWVVKLTRKVLGDYNLAVTYTQRYGPDRPIQLGALHCQGIGTQTGYVVVTSHLDLRLQLASDPSQGQTAATANPLLPIALDELHADYRLLTSSPILAAYKYVTEPHTALLTISPYQRSELLPVVVDIADVKTRLAVRPDGQVESVTTVRYKVKNTTGQFLALTMPPGTRVWAVSSIEAKPGTGEQSIRLAASHNQETGQLLIPLRRQVNPNDPATIELEYGQVHPSGAWWRRTVELAAPRCVVPTAYTDWQVTVPDRWAIAPAGGNMHARINPQARVGLAGLVQEVISWWKTALDRYADDEFWILCGLIAVLVLVFALVRRQYVPDLIVLAILLPLAWIGIKGRTAPPAPVETQDFASLRYAQAVGVDPDQSPRVSVELVPAWRRAIRARDAIGVAAVIVTALVLALVWRRLRRVAPVAVVTALVYLAAKVPATWPVLLALTTWLAPLAIIAWFLYRLWRRQSVPAQAVAAMMVLLVMCACGGCSGLGPNPQLAAGRTAMERIECSLSAGADNMELKYSLHLSVDRPSDFALVDESAVLVSPAKPQGHVTWQTRDGQHVVCVDEPGVYDIQATFLAPLPPAGEDQQRRFELPLPVALTNRISLVIPDANVSVEAPQAVLLTSSQQEGQTQIEARFAPGMPATFTWRPLERQAAQEQVRFYAQDLALARVTPGLLQVFHEVRLQIAQGQVDRLVLDVGRGQTVTSVEGPQLAAWRFDPLGPRLEVRLGRPVTGSYALTVVTQSASASVPYDVHLEPLLVRQALDQHSIIGLGAEPSVYVQLDRHPAAMNIQDYVREIGPLVKIVPGLALEQIGQAFRFGDPQRDPPGSGPQSDGHPTSGEESRAGPEPRATAVTGRVLAVQSEIRSQEVARFNVEDDRLVYNSQWEIEIAKAGRFDMDLLMPAGFDIDALEAQEVSHWDESVEADQRRVRVHFKHRLTGPVRLKLALSQAITEVPDRLTVPRVTVSGVLKHSGHLVIGSEQGVRLSVASRQGVSEINPAELGSLDAGLLAFQFLRPDWQLHLQTELIQPRITVQSLHVARVTDGLVRHQHTLRYQLYHAGTKTFGLTLPPEAVGVTITGPGIARREQSGPGQWRVELADKVYDRPYLMSVTYETRYDPADGNVPLVPVRCQDADLQQGYIAVFATDRVELAAQSTDAALRPADARSIPEYFGATDLAGAAMCYRSIFVETQNLASLPSLLTIRARRHAVADQIGAEALRTDLMSVVTATGQTINRVALLLRVGSQRHLQTILPESAVIWSLAVDGQAVQPSLRTTAEGREALLVPLPQQASGDVLVEMIYVGSSLSAMSGGRIVDWSGQHTLSGPRFDLPLKNITWWVYMPEGFTYGDFGGTIPINRRAAEGGNVLRYDLQTYQQQILAVIQRNEYVAQQQQTLARELAQKGEQTAARQALTKGYNFSIGNTALNEDIRVDLDNLLRRQAKVGLVNARGRLRQQTGGAPPDQAPGVIPPDSQAFSQQQAERIESSLGQADNENLELITRRIIQTQTAAEASVSQLQVTMPVCGRMLQFSSPLQVEPATEMALAFTAKPQRLARVDPSLWYGSGLFAFLLICGAIVRGLGRLGARLRRRLTPAPKPTQPTEPPQPSKPFVRDNRDDSNGRVSAEELL